MLSNHCLSCLSVCNIGVLWPNGWMDQDETWHRGRPRPRPHCVGWGPSSPQRHSRPPIFGPRLLWPNDWMDQDATWYGGRPRARPHSVRWGPSPPGKWAQQPHFSAHVYCGQTVAMSATAELLYNLVLHNHNQTVISYRQVRE